MDFVAATIDSIREFLKTYYFTLIAITKGSKFLNISNIRENKINLFSQFFSPQ